MTLHHGDCLDVMAGMESESVDAVVTDPPYDLTSTGARKGSPRNPGTGPYSRGFMGKAWDGTGIAFRPETWAAALRVAKPSAYLLAFGGTRTVHRMTVAIEDAGWLIRDCLVWAYASGFPKSKASLKPAWEPIVMARKPGPLRMLAIDECRIPFVDGETDDREGETTASMRYTLDGGTDLAAKPGRRIRSDRAAAAAVGYASSRARGTNQASPSIGRESRDGTNAYDPFAIPGRWPANVILTDPIFDGGTTIETYGDSGTYSRFFLIPKADRTDREPVLRTDRELPFDDFNRNVGNTLAVRRRNSHPTVKPVDLMRHLVRLVTPTGGTVLDPFLGSGTTALACEMEGFDWVGIEREAEYVAIAEARLNGVQKGLGLPA